MSKGYDPQCQILAEYFIEGDQSFTKAHIGELAQRIQDTVEDFLSEKQDEQDAALEHAKDEAVDRAIDEKQLGEDI